MIDLPDLGTVGTLGAGAGGGGALVFGLGKLLDYWRDSRKDATDAHTQLISTLTARVTALEALCTSQGTELLRLTGDLSTAQSELRWLRSELDERDAKIASLREQRRELRRTAPIEIGADTSTPVAGLPAAHRGDGQ